MAFVSLLGLTIWSLAWLHLTVVRIKRAARIEAVSAVAGTWAVPEATP
jgi:hypothetical protein